MNAKEAKEALATMIDQAVPKYAQNAPDDRAGWEDLHRDLGAELKGIELRLVEMNSALAVAIACAERICCYGEPTMGDRESLLNALRDMRTTLKGLLDKPPQKLSPHVREMLCVMMDEQAREDKHGR